MPKGEQLHRCSDPNPADVPLVDTILQKQLNRRQFITRLIQGTFLVSGGIAMARLYDWAEPPPLATEPVPPSVLSTILGPEYRTPFGEKDPIWKIIFDLNHEHIGFAEATALTLRFDNLLKQLPDGYKPFRLPEFFTEEDVQLEIARWMATIAGNYPYNRVMSGYAPEVEVEVATLYNGLYHNHVRGYTRCDKNFALNQRHFNPHDSWFQDIGIVATMAHEYVHVIQGKKICHGADVKDVEKTAQVVSVEVMASTINAGVRELLYPLLDELRDYSLGTAYLRAREAKTMPAFLRLKDYLSSGGSWSASAFRRSRRHWSTDETRLTEILTNYSEAPLLTMTKAFRSEFPNFAEDLALPLEYPSYRYFETQEPGDPFPLRGLLLDDLADVLMHVEDLVAEYTLS